MNVKIRKKIEEKLNKQKVEAFIEAEANAIPIDTNKLIVIKSLCEHNVDYAELLLGCVCRDTVNKLTNIDKIKAELSRLFNIEVSNDELKEMLYFSLWEKSMKVFTNRLIYENELGEELKVLLANYGLEVSLYMQTMENNNKGEIQYEK